MIPHVLIIEDDDRLAALLAEYLQAQGHTVAVENDGRRAIERIERAPPDAVVLDMMIPTVSGLDVLRAVRPRYVGAVLILTANKAEVDQVVGLELGASRASPSTWRTPSSCSTTRCASSTSSRRSWCSGSKPTRAASNAAACRSRRPSTSSWSSSAPPRRATSP